jgi:hypothetical protein
VIIVSAFAVSLEFSVIHQQESFLVKNERKAVKVETLKRLVLLHILLTLVPYPRWFVVRY